jgi:uncharacterized membrane protein
MPVLDPETAMALNELLPLIGVPLLVAGFLLRLNPILVVVGAAVVTGLAVGIAPLDLLELIGGKFLNARLLAIFMLFIPMIGLLDRYGLRERAQAWIAGFRQASAGRLLLVYFVVRELCAALNLPIGGQISTVRPLLAPMAEGAAVARHGPLPDRATDRIRAHAAAAENIGTFFGEDIFFAYGAVLLMDAFLRENGISNVEPLQIGLWAIPTALAAMLIHGIRLTRLDAQIARDVEQAAS